MWQYKFCTLRTVSSHRIEITAEVGDELKRRPYGELSPQATEGVTDCHF